MTRNLKALGLAAMATLALGAVFASGASAQVGVLTADEDFTLTGIDTGPASANSFTSFGSELRCETVYTGHEYDQTPHEFIQSGSSTVTLTTHTANCRNSEETPLEVRMNGCDDILHIGVTTGGEHTYAAKLDIDCPEGKAIEIVGGPCTITIRAQTGLEGAHLTHTTEPASDIDLEGTFGGVHAEACGFLTTNEAELHRDITFEAHDTFEQPIGVTISH